MTWLHWKQFFLPEWRTTPAFRVLASSAWQLEINMLLPLIGRTTQRCQEPWKIWDGIQQLMNVMIKRSAEYLTVMGSGQFFEETTLSFPFSWYFKNKKLHTPDTGGETSHFHSLCPLRSTDEGNCSNYFLQVLDCGFLSSERIEGLPVPSKSRPVALRLRVQLLPFLPKSKAPCSSRCHKMGFARAAESLSRSSKEGGKSKKTSCKWFLKSPQKPQMSDLWPWAGWRCRGCGCWCTCCSSTSWLRHWFNFSVLAVWAILNSVLKSWSVPALSVKV